MTTRSTAATARPPPPSSSATPWPWRRTAGPAPRDDIVTKLVHAQVDGGQLSADEFGFFVILLAVAGNETTRNAISARDAGLPGPPGPVGAVPGRAARDRGRRDRPVGDPGDGVPAHRAGATPTLGGQQIRAGQRVGLFYRSANFDEEVFDSPERFDIRRSPNPHLGFGGTGTHYCLGANLARLEIDLMFNAIADGMPGHPAGRATRSGCAPAGSTASSGCRSATGNGRAPAGRCPLRRLERPIFRRAPAVGVSRPRWLPRRGRRGRRRKRPSGARHPLGGRCGASRCGLVRRPDVVRVDDGLGLLLQPQEEPPDAPSRIATPSTAADGARRSAREVQGRRAAARPPSAAGI